MHLQRSANTPRARLLVARILRRLTRKLTKPLALCWNAWQLEKSKDDVSHFESVRVYLANKEQQEALRQVRLLRRRNEIAGW